MTVIDRERERSSDRSPLSERRLRRAWRWATAHPVLAAVVVALGVRVVFAVVVSVAIDGVLVPDEQQYLDLADMASSGRLDGTVWRGYAVSLYETAASYTKALTQVFRLFGPNDLVARIFSALFGAATAGATAELTRRLLPQRALVAGLVVALLPSQVLWSSVVLRESMVWITIAAPAVALAVAARERRHLAVVALLLASAFSFYVSSYIRPQTMVIAIWCFALAGLTFRARRPLLVPIGGLLVALLVPWYVGMGPGAQYFVEYRALGIARSRAQLSFDAESAFVKVDDLPTAPVTTTTTTTTTTTEVAPPSSGPGPVEPTTTTTTATTTTADVPPEPTTTTVPDDEVIYRGDAAYVVDNSVAANFRHLPTGLVAVALRPFPWERPSSAGLVLAQVENVVWAAAYVLGAIGAWAGRARRDVLGYPFLLLGGVTFVAALTQGNLGTAFRHRGQILWALAPFVVLGAHAVQERRRRRDAG